MSAARNTKFSTHLALTTDIVLGLPNSKEYVHEIDSTIFDLRKGQVDVTTVVWARTPPEQGIYIVNQFSLSTADKLLLVANDANCMRRLPEDYEGQGPLLPNVLAYLNGHGCIMSVDEDRKGAIVGGFVYQGKAYGWKEYKVHLHFGEGMRFSTWTMPPPRTLVSFEGIWEGVAEDDGLIKASVCRIATIDTAPQALLLALGIGTSAATNKAAHLRQLRAKAAVASPPPPTTPKDTVSPVPVHDGQQANMPDSTPTPAPKAVLRQPSPSPAPRSKRVRTE
ncbi:hypothetical protein CF319_g7485 [Tilletia indica]|uniref:Uncharacterized protein n=1 Tax=Tilletia indica TaxID=43049 RepID=A0A177TR20_9BASI|nr:hypothetical protein CF319_g7485 [Tilletia indica]KAE8250482.1 hypothetical protein A4X13_0g4694 [Tilletia indica]